MLLVLLIAPVVAYVAVFGVRITAEHQRWSEFGSFMSGVYGPMVALVTLAVLGMQMRLQRQMNEHEFDQSYIEQSRADIEFYVAQLAGSLQTNLSTGNTVREVLRHQFQPNEVPELDSQRLRDVAKLLDDEAPNVLALTHGIYPILAGLGSSEKGAFQLNLKSALQKMVAMLGFEMCVALENYQRCRSEGSERMSYRFSRLLRTNAP